MVVVMMGFAISMVRLKPEEHPQTEQIQSQVVD
jgi:hypothetical protein